MKVKSFETGKFAEGYITIRSFSLYKKILLRLGNLLIGVALNHQTSLKNSGEAWLLGELQGLDVCIDIGANTGGYSQMILDRHPAAEVIAVEPIPEFYEQCAANLRGRATVVREAVSNSGDSVVIYKKGGGANADPSRGSKSQDYIRHVIPTIRGDELLIKYKVAARRVSLIKIDTDGSDFSALQSFESAIIRARPVIQIEAGRFWAFTETAIQSLLLWAQKHHYSVFVLGRRQLLEVPYLSAVTWGGGSFNLVLLPFIDDDLRRPV